MKLIQPSVEIVVQDKGIQGIYNAIEYAGRTCYKSEDKITDNSAKEFVDRMIKSGHGAMLEFGTVYLKVNIGELGTDSVAYELWYKYTHNHYSKAVQVQPNSPLPYGYVAITTNYRVVMQGDYNTWYEAFDNHFDKSWKEDLQYSCEPTEYHERRVCARFNCSIAISRELNRHRVNSIAEQSTRYCNFTKDKFNNCITFIKPCWIRDNLCNTYVSELDIIAKTPKDNYLKEEELFLNSLISAERNYFELINLGCKAQEARELLPLNTGTVVNHCTFISDWKHFFKLRNSHKAHPDMEILAQDLYSQFKTKKLL